MPPAKPQPAQAVTPPRHTANLPDILLLGTAKDSEVNLLVFYQHRTCNLWLGFQHLSARQAGLWVCERYRGCLQSLLMMAAALCRSALLKPRVARAACTLGTLAC